MIQSQTATVRLRKTLSPYAGFFVIFSIVSLLMFITGIIAKDRDTLWLSLCVLLFCGVLTFLMMSSYRIFWNETGVTMGVDLRKNTIPFTEITSVQYVSGYNTSRTSPFRKFNRIVIRGHDKRKDYIEISLHHFHSEDIATLMDEISKRRPDIEIPW